MDQVSGDPTVGIVGTGKMGAGMWRRLQGQGHTATVYDVIPAATAALAALGAPVASDPADLAKAVDLVILSLPRSSDVEAAVARPERARGRRARGHHRPRHHQRGAEREPASRGERSPSAAPSTSTRA